MHNTVNHKIFNYKNFQKNLTHLLFEILMVAWSMQQDRAGAWHGLYIYEKLCYSRKKDMLSLYSE